MPSRTAVCPRCSEIVQIAAPAAGKKIHCPACGTHFVPTRETGQDEPIGPRPRSADLHPNVPVPRPIIGTAVGIALVGAVLAVGAGIAGVLYLNRQPGAPEPAPKTSEVTKTSEVLPKEDKQDRKEQVKAPQDTVDPQKDEKQRRQEFQRQLVQGNAALAGERFDEAALAYAEALKLFPEDVDAAKGLAAARAGQSAQAKEKKGAEQRQADYARLMGEGKAAAAGKQYAAAVRAFEAALQLIPSDADATRELANARESLASDQSEKKKLADYEAFMTAGRAAMVAQRYTDAVREYTAALKVMPGDAAALQARRQAEKRTEEVEGLEKRRSDFQKLAAQGASALRAQRYHEAITAYEDALKLVPDDRDAQQGLRQAKQALNDIKAEFTRLMAQGDLALQAQRYEEALRFYNDALRIVPTNELAQRAARTAEKMIGDLQAAQLAYIRFMNQGTLALRNKRYQEALQAFAEALRLVPNDRDATKGMREARAALDIESANRASYNKQMQAALSAYRQRKYNDALNSYREALILIPEDPQATAGFHQARYAQHMEDGNNAMTGKRYTEAAREFEGALKHMPGDAAANNALRQARALIKK